MPFQSEAHQKVFENIKDLMFRLYGEVNVGTPKDDELTLWKGSTCVHVQVFPFPYRKDTHYVYIWAVCVYECPYSRELAEWIVRTNTKVYFGHFQFLEYKDQPGIGNVVFEYMAPADKVDKQSLDVSVEAVAYYADYYDEEVAKLFGGMTAYQSWEKYNRQKKGDEDCK